MALHPALMTTTFVCDSSVKSAEMSNSKRSRKRCTPPIPPVENVVSPAAEAICAVAATVVDAQSRFVTATRIS